MPIGQLPLESTIIAAEPREGGCIAMEIIIKSPPDADKSEGVFVFGTMAEFLKCAHNLYF